MAEAYSKEYLSITSLKHLAYRLNFPLWLLEEVAEKTGRYYKFKPRKKPNGDVRYTARISQPLKKIQIAIHQMLKEVYIPDYVHGGINNKSNYTNAEKHCKNEILFKLDLEKYFPSISNNRIYGLFVHELKCSLDVAKILTKLCTINGKLPEGASMSTDIANLVFRKTDYRLKGLATGFGLEYTRFVDDMTFSGNKIPQSFINIVRAIIKDSGFKLNNDKEELRARHQPQIVTGLNVKFKKPRVPRSKKREWLKEKHLFEKYGVENLYERDRIKKKLQIAGRLNYINHIENIDS